MVNPDVASHAIRLSHGRSAVGRLTVDKRSTSGLHADCRVFAAHVGHDRRADYVLSVWSTPQADGTFTLAGLTPGDYLVQASLDNTWLSASTPLHVDADRGPADLSLDIPPPAGPVAVEVVDAGRHPVVGRSVTVDRPGGPLTNLDWPDHFTTDGAGVAYIPALEAGPHRVHVGGVTVLVTPPSLPCEAATVVRCVDPSASVTRPAPQPPAGPVDR